MHDLVATLRRIAGTKPAKTPAALLVTAGQLRHMADEIELLLGRADYLGRSRDEALREVTSQRALVASLIEHAPPGHPDHSCGGPQEACMQPGCPECRCPTMEEALAIRAERNRLNDDVKRLRGLLLQCRGFLMDHGYAVMMRDKINAECGTGNGSPS